MSQAGSQEISTLSTLFGVEGLVAVVTGGATGIGLMIATALETNGAIVYIVSRNKENLDKAVKERSRRGNLIAIQADVTNRDALKGVVDTIKAKHGYIDLLVNNAGVMRNEIPQPIPKPATAGDDITKLQDVLWNSGTPEDWADTFNVNVTAVYYATVAFLELLHEGNKRGNRGAWSQVITISSLASFRKDDQVMSMSYTLSKVAVTHLGKTLAHVLKDWKIRSNIINPGLFPSDMTKPMGLSDEQVRRIVPMERWGGVDDIGGLVLFLASKAGAYVDGVAHIIDGARLTLFPSTY